MGSMYEERALWSDDPLGIERYHAPCICEKCGGVMVFQGVGEYSCEICKEVAYDDYGKVRAYLEKNRGANVAEVENATGVKHKTINMMLREAKLEVADTSKLSMLCTACGKRITSGRLCSKCEAEFHRRLEARQREILNDRMKGFAVNLPTGESGAKRFTRE